MLQFKVLVLELFTVDGLPTGTVAGCEVAALDHELLDHAVKNGAFV